MNKDKRKRGEKSAVIPDRRTSEQVRQIARKVLGQIIGKMTTAALSFSGHCNCTTLVIQPIG